MKGIVGGVRRQAGHSSGGPGVFLDGCCQPGACGCAAARCGAVPWPFCPPAPALGRQAPHPWQPPLTSGCCRGLGLPDSHVPGVLVREAGIWGQVERCQHGRRPRVLGVLMPAGPGGAGAAGGSRQGGMRHSLPLLAASLRLPGTVTSLLRPCPIPGAGGSRRRPIRAACCLPAAGPQVPSLRGALTAAS